jgi:hypothetical protein
MLLMRKQGDLAWHAPQVTAYTNEEALEALIAQSPDLLPGLSEARMVVVRQLTLPVGYVDMVGVDVDGEITVVECKLKKNPEIRREVVGQVLAYASALWRLSYEEFDHSFAARAGASLTQRLAALETPDWDEETFRASVANNLARGRVRLIIVVDQITDELKNIVLYLNQHTGADLQFLALELGYIADDGVEILVPAVYGKESVEGKNKPTGQTLQAEEAVQAVEHLCTPGGAEAARRLFAFAKQRGAIFKPSVGKHPTASARFKVNGRLITIFSIVEWPQGYGGCSVYFGNLLSAGVPDETLARFADQLLKIQDAAKPLADVAKGQYNKYPTLSLNQVLGSEAAITQFQVAVDDLFQALGIAVQG